MKLLFPLRALSACCALLFLAGCGPGGGKPPEAVSGAPDYLRLMNSGKNYLDQGQGQKALEAYEQAVKLSPGEADVHLNRANAQLLLGNAPAAIQAAEEALRLDANLAAAHFVKGAALMRQQNVEEALKALQTARNLDLGEREPALGYLLGAAHAKLEHWDEAIGAFMEVVTDQPEHPAASYQLSQALLRAGRDAEAQQALEVHQRIAEKNAGSSITEAKLEKSKYTQARVPFVLELPAKEGVSVKFAEDTARAFGADAAKYSGPIAIMHPNGALAAGDTNQPPSLNSSLFVFEPEQGFRLLWNSNGVFTARDEPLPAIPRAKYAKMLVGDLQNDRYEDVVVIGDKGTHIFKFATNGSAMDVAPFSRLQGLTAADAALVDIDFTGKLDLAAVTAVTNDVRLYRQFGPLLFTDITRTSGIPLNLHNARSITVDDWPKDEMMDLIIGRGAEKPLLLAKLRGGPLAATNLTDWSLSSLCASGDLNNDLRTDLVAASPKEIHIVPQGIQSQITLLAEDANIRQVQLIDYDNDGWLDILAAGDRLTFWRNLGQFNFINTSKELGLDALPGPFNGVHFADFDVDGDSDLVLLPAQGGLKFLRNDGGSANRQLKLRLLGNRSNASGLGVKVEITSGGLRLIRTVQSLPVEIGVGKNDKLESVVVHWFNLAASNIDVPVDTAMPLPIFELILPEGSCPYMYAWDGQKFRFVTDLLGAAPLGLPVADGIYIQADPDEYAWIGNETNFVPKDGYYTVQITEELREALYLDEAKLTVVDHPEGTEVHPTDKLMPGRPFPPSGFMTLRHEIPLRHAENLAGREVTDLLLAEDGRRVSPTALRIPQQRGQAEPHGVILDFGELPADRRLALVLNGWLRFGGGMANINASHDPSLPFPFPTLEAETASGWQKTDVTVGAPAGKTKTIVADLIGKLPPGSRRLRLQAAFEIHWDRIALMERGDASATRVTHIAPHSADLHWRGFSEFKDLPWDWPLTPDYEKVSPNPKWRITPAGWHTRYGEVGELIAQRDEGLLIMNGGDELTLSFAASELPPKQDGFIRQFFIYSDGWDKDSDFHVRTGTAIEPLPWHGQDDQAYGLQPRPAFPSDWLHKKYNTRWVAPQVLDRAGLR